MLAIQVSKLSSKHSSCLAVKEAMSKMVGLSEDVREKIQREEAKTEDDFMEDMDEDKPMTAEQKRTERCASYQAILVLFRPCFCFQSPVSFVVSRKIMHSFGRDVHAICVIKRLSDDYLFPQEVVQGC
jgi:hypothetical protein